MKLGIVADIHGNDVALRAVLADADRFEVDHWWALGDHVLFGPRPVAEVVIGGHTHFATDRLVGGIRALNPGSTGLPRTCGIANWLLLKDDGDKLVATHRTVAFDVDTVVADLRRRRHPNAEFAASILTGLHQM